MSRKVQNWGFTILVIAVGTTIGIYTGRWAHSFVLGVIAGLAAMIVEALVAISLKKLSELFS